MDFADFKSSLSKSKPPMGLPAALLARWWAGKDKCNEAHRIVMNEDGKDCAWVHAYLHRLEGRGDNARYWYRQAKCPIGTGTFPNEWKEIARTFLAAE